MPPKQVQVACSCEIAFCDAARFFGTIRFDWTLHPLHAKVIMSSLDPRGNVIGEIVAIAMFDWHTGHSGDVVILIRPSDLIRYVDHVSGLLPQNWAASSDI
jgi:hypothetical protein